MFGHGLGLPLLPHILEVTMIYCRHLAHAKHPACRVPLPSSTMYFSGTASGMLAWVRPHSGYGYSSNMGVPTYFCKTNAYMTRTCRKEPTVSTSSSPKLCNSVLRPRDSQIEQSPYEWANALSDQGTRDPEHSGPSAVR